MSDQSIYARVARVARKWPERAILDVLPETASSYGIDAGPISYAAFLRDVDDWAERFETAGYGAGMRVAVLLENRPEFFVIFCALNKLGASIVPINPDLRIAELSYLIDHAEPALVITLPSRLDEIQRAISQTDMDVEAIPPDAKLSTPRSTAIVAEKLHGEAREAAVLYTSGTTGAPKGCVLPNTYFLLAGDWYADLGGIASLSTKGARMITPLPIFHMNAMAYSFMAMVTVGGCLIALDRFHPRTWWDSVASARATCLHYLGVMPSILMSLPWRRD